MLNSNVANNRGYGFRRLTELKGSASTLITVPSAPTPATVVSSQAPELT